MRLWRELKERGFADGYSAVRDRVRELRPSARRTSMCGLKTLAGEQPQVDFARFEVANEPRVQPIVWLFSMVLGYSRLIWVRFVVHQNLRTVLRCHVGALEAIGGVPREILHDRMQTAVLGEDAEGLVVYNRALIDLARHYGFQLRACRPYRVKTKAKAERPFRYVREDYFLGGHFRNLDEAQGQLRHWLDKNCLEASSTSCLGTRQTIDTLVSRSLQSACHSSLNESSSSSSATERWTGTSQGAQVFCTCIVTR